MKRKLSKQIHSLFSPNSLRIQLLFRSLLILTILLALIGMLQYLFMRNVIYSKQAENFRTQIMSLPPPVWDFTNFHPDDDGMGPKRIFIPQASLAFIDDQGNYIVLANGPDNTEPPQLDRQKYLDVLNQRPDKHGQHSPGYIITGSGATEQLLVIMPIRMDSKQVQGVAQVSTPTAPLKELLLRQSLAFFILSIIALLFGLAAFLPVLKKTLVPLNNMIDSAEQIDAGNLDRRFPTQQGQLEIDRLAESCNGMLERLESSFAAELETKEQMRRFVADASHELRTPLTSIHGFLEVLLRGAANQPEQLDKALRSMHSESQRLNKLVHNLLLLTKLDRSPHIELTKGSLDAVIKEMEPQLRILAGSRRLNLSIKPEVRCQYNSDQMKQVVLNLFHNAVQQTDPDKGNINIFLIKKDRGAELSIQDNGPGISSSHLQHIFDRFYRSDSSRTRKYGGAGLGLAITKSIVDAHGGTISVTSREGEGCTFHVWLPE